jgi:hypothetical protein
MAKSQTTQNKPAPVMRKNYSKDAAGSAQYQKDLKAANKATVSAGKAYFKAAKKVNFGTAKSPKSKAKPMNSCVKK